MRLRVPHTFVLLFALLVLAAIATHLLPAGRYERVAGPGGRELVDPASYREVAAAPAGVADVLLAYPRGLVETAVIVFYIFLIGGAFGVITATGAIDAAIHGVVAACRGRGEVVIPLLVVGFSFGGATIGMAEETLPFLPMLVVLARRLGYDEVVAGGIALAGAGAGFSGAFLNPFTLGVGQQIAGLPPLSGLGYRLVVWVVITAVTVAYVAWYAARVRAGRLAAAALAAAPAPERARSPASGGGVDARSGSGEPLPTELAPGSSAEVASPAASEPAPARAGASARELAVLGLLLAGLLAVVVGALHYGWGILEMSGLFVALAVLSGLVGGLGADATAERFVAGAAAMTGGALVVGLARGVLVIFDRAAVTDTILHGLVGLVAGLPPAVTVVGIYAVQVVLSYVVPSGSGQAALSLPILAPLGDLVGVTRQTTVLAYQFGDGFSNVFTPTQGYFMAGLALIGVSWVRWARFMWPLQLLWLACGLVLLLIAHAMRWGP
jgi:uncharacterized ion transporter superfamily protein YfcC